MTGVVVVFSVWLALTIVNCIPAGRRRITWPLEAFGILPPLSLFAPDPVDADYHLTWRDYQADGTCSGWKEATFEPAPRWRAVWNPDGRDRNALLCAASSLAVLSAIAPQRQYGEGLVLLSFPYLFLLNAASVQRREPGVVARQFMLVETRGFGRERRASVGIVSEVHALDSL